MSRFSLRLLATCSLLIGLVFVQDPGFLAADTKFDLAVAPGDFLARALHLWDAEGAFGQLQNQAYGYLWPMGPFFWLGAALDLPGWVVQRLWQSLVVCVAFTGAARVARALGVRSDLAAIVAGLAFALSPRMLTTLGPISIEAWPSALAPWVLLPLVLGAQRGSARRAAALSALAVAMVGGVNAAATFAVIPMGAIWLLTREPGPRRRAMMLWWPLFTALGTLWWLVPLFVMGAYSPPFLDYIETSSVTTLPTTLFDALRGSSNWVPYIDARSRAGNDLVTTWYLPVVSGVVLLVGVAGLVRRRTPHRPFLALSLLVGLVMVTAGHQGAVAGWFAGDLAQALDEVLSPVRNVHKFDPIVRLPLVLGLGFVLDRAVELARARATDVGAGAWLERYGFVVMTVAAVAGAASPALQTRVEPAGATLAVPGYWHEAAEWLAQRDPQRTALVVPGAPFAEYTWGSPQDEPLQFLADSPWAVRNVVPLAPPGNVRLLDAIEDRLVQGHGSPGLTALLRRAGVGHLVVRNDLERSDDVPDPVAVHQAIARSPGIGLVASFGPLVGGEAHLEGVEGRVVVNGGWQAEFPAVEVYAVSGSDTAAVTSSSVPVVVGGPEDLGDLADLRLLAGEPTVLAADLEGAGLAQPPGRWLLTDGFRARERSFARIHDGYSPVLTPGDRRRTGNPARDYRDRDDDRWATTVRLEGASALRASSSASDSISFGGSRRGNLPYAAVDGAEDTAWTSGAARDDRAWWEVELATPIELPEVVLVGGPDADRDQLVRVVTDAGASEPVALTAGERREVLLPTSEPVDRVRVEDASGPGHRTISLAEVSLPGVAVQRTLVLPEIPEEWGSPDAIVLRADRDRRDGCVEVGLELRCAQGRDVPDEEPHGLRRAFTVPDGGEYGIAVRVYPRSDRALERLILRRQPVDVWVSSKAVPDPRATSLALVDGDPGTSWIADVDDAQPVVEVSWLGTQTVRAISLSLDDDAAARLPTRVRLTWPTGSRTVDLDQGRAAIGAIRTDRLRLTVLDAEPTGSLGFDQRGTELGVGIGELEVTGVPYLPLKLSSDPVRRGCDSGPRLRVAGKVLGTAVSASDRALLSGRPVRARPCTAGDAGGRPVRVPSAVTVGKGETVVAAGDSDAFEVSSVVLRLRGAAATRPTVRQRVVEASDPVSRSVVTAEGDAILALRTNTNPGWTASLDGDPLQPVVVDGWQQAFWLPPDDPAGVVAMHFGPDRLYRWGLLAGGLAAAGLAMVMTLVRRRRAGAEPSPTGARSLPGPAALVLALVGAGLLAGWPGLAIGVLAAVSTVGVRARRRATYAWWLAAPVLVAASWYAVRPWGSSEGWAGEAMPPQYLVLFSVVAVVVSAADEPRPRRRQGGSRLRQRMAGSSTSR
ncbi:alpha-(1-_3)-arabinofuranosyltransferase domain-containing protein [Nocardioides ferulae]|uniref:alpha-(1->3)-arabinofuranosyltransferase domain-containing protein n=1 Tax=Nocardioides ferulae TaxID=2340821 RepID=UPI000EACA9AA|nr:alpha-(1->3)-arabinofuranosyltransferase family protein [Nocardioides ferulae]